jgi:hypothetical protein
LSFARWTRTRSSGGPAASPDARKRVREPPQQRRRRARADDRTAGSAASIAEAGRRRAAAGIASGPPRGGRSGRSSPGWLAALRRPLGVQGGDDAAGRRRRQRSIGGDVSVEVGRSRVSPRNGIRSIRRVWHAAAAARHGAASAGGDGLRRRSR